jgi:hypothetical protein
MSKPSLESKCLATSVQKMFLSLKDVSAKVFPPFSFDVQVSAHSFNHLKASSDKDLGNIPALDLKFFSQFSDSEFSKTSVQTISYSISYLYYFSSNFQIRRLFQVVTYSTVAQQDRIKYFQYRWFKKQDTLWDLPRIKIFENVGPKYFNTHTHTGHQAWLPVDYLCFDKSNCWPKSIF